MFGKELNTSQLVNRFDTACFFKSIYRNKLAFFFPENPHSTYMYTLKVVKCKFVSGGLSYSGVCFPILSFFYSVLPKFSVSKG